MRSPLVALFAALLVCLATAETCQEQGIGISATQLDGTPSFTWHRDGNIVFALSSAQTLYRSVDSGRTWTSQRDILGGSVLSVLDTADPDTFIFRGFTGTAMWTTTDAGATYSDPRASSTPKRRYFSIVRHPFIAQAWIGEFLVYPTAPSFCPECAVGTGTNVWEVTLNGGSTFQCIGVDIADADWLASSTDTSSTQLVITYNQGANSNALGFDLAFSTSLTEVVETDNPLCPTDIFGTVVLNNVVGFIRTHDIGVLWVAIQTEISSCLSLVITTDLTTWTAIELPPFSAAFEKGGFSLADVSPGNAMIRTIESNANRFLPGSLFVGGNIVSYFSSSLYNTTGDSFTIVSGVPGFYIVNRITGPVSNSPSITSYFTSNKGGAWRPLVTNLGQSMNLHGFASGSGIGPYSPALGIVWGLGNLGTTLDLQSSILFFSDDGGQTFKNVWLPQTPQIMETADSGNLNVFASFGPDASTHFLVYSLDRFATAGISCTFAESDLNIANIQTSYFNGRYPSNTRQDFLLFGTNATGAYVFHLDFSNMYSYTCEDTDYEAWAPQPCLLGSSLSFVRRQASANCSIVNSAVPGAPLPVPCACTPADYFCGRCYQTDQAEMLATGTATCTAIAGCEASSCNAEYDGYRRVAGDTCVTDIHSVWAGQCPPTSVLPGQCQADVVTSGASQYTTTSTVVPRSINDAGLVAILVILCLILVSWLGITFGLQAVWFFYRNSRPVSAGPAPVVAGGASHVSAAAASGDSPARANAARGAPRRGDYEAQFDASSANSEF